jgi:uncharacterized RDD family membrane protein YckC
MANSWDSPSFQSDLGKNGPLETPRGMFPLATFRQRALAWLIDMVILTLISEVFFQINQTDANTIAAIVDLGYMVLLLGGPYGQTVGAKIARVRVVRLDGKQLGYLRAAARYLVAGISAIVFALGYLWMLRDPKNQTWHDKAAGSLVISLVPIPTIETAQAEYPDRPYN